MDAKERFKRQIDIIKTEELDFPIHILGAGGIGSWTAMTLAMMGCQNITVYDDDEVEDHNVASQLYKEKQLGKNKVHALADNVKEQSGLDIVTATKDAENNIITGLVIITIDSMESRARLAELYKDKDVYIIDGRMGGLQLEIYCYSAKEYPKTIVPQGEVTPEACTARSICFNCAVIGGLIANYVRMFGKKELKDQEITFGFNEMLLVK